MAKHILWLTVAALMISAVGARAQEPTEAQLLKAFGHLPNVTLGNAKAARFGKQLAEDVLSDRICFHPDHADREIADAEIGNLMKHLGLDRQRCQWLKSAHQRMLRATGSGSWPDSCHDQYDGWHSITYFVDEDSFPAHYKQPVKDNELRDLEGFGYSADKALAKWRGKQLLHVALDLADESFRRAGCAHIRTFDHDDANVHLLSRPIPGSTIGVAWFNDGTCTDHVEHHIDSTWRPGLHSLAKLLTHEFGHNHNLPHTFRNQDRHKGIMSYRSKYPFVGFADGNGDRPKDPSWPQLIRQYGGEPVPVEGEEPDPGDGGGGSLPVKVGDTIEVVLGGRRIIAKVSKIEGDEGPSMSARVTAAVNSIEGYANKERDREALATVYTAIAEGTANGSLTIEQAIVGAKTLRGLLVTGDQWAKVYEIADEVKTAAGFAAVRDGLLAGRALSPELVAIIKVIVDLLPEGRFKTIAKIILALIGGIGGEGEGEKVGAVQRTQKAIVPSRRRRPFVAAQVA